MQRIDENTYIDDSLVTCAEYQLFIDEMRELGKYYQPDHWTSYQFPQGQAREPILGVRHSDTVALCYWLTNREGKEWVFRLPNKEEADAFPMKPLARSPLGYWLHEKSRFVWVGYHPSNPRKFTATLGNDLDLSQAIWRAHGFAVNFHKFQRRNFFDLNTEIEQVDVRATYVPNEKIDGRKILSDALSSANALDLSDTERIKRSSKIHHNLDDYFDLFVDLFTLQERIAGRSPAFEGIRLVKERIR